MSESDPAPESTRIPPAAEAADDEPVDPKLEELTSYLDGEVSPEEADRIETQLARDRKLRQEADTLKRAWDLLDFLPRSEPSPDFTERTLSQIAPVPEGTASNPGTARNSSATMIPRMGASSSPSVLPLPAPSPFRWSAFLVWSLLFLVGLSIGWVVQVPIRKAIDPNFQKSDDSQLIQDIRILENLKYYKEIEDFAFLEAIDHPDLFGEDETNHRD